MVILGAEVTLLLSVAAMNIYRWRTDVLIGSYISRDGQPAVSDAGGDTGSRGNTISSATSNGWRPLRLKRTNRSQCVPTSQKADVRRKGNLPCVPQAERAILLGSNQFDVRSINSLIQRTLLAGPSGTNWRWLPIQALAHQRRSRPPLERRSNAVNQTCNEPFEHDKLGPHNVPEAIARCLYSSGAFYSSRALAISPRSVSSGSGLLPEAFGQTRGPDSFSDNGSVGIAPSVSVTMRSSNRASETGPAGG
jgi:hypothetical protein